MGMVKCALCGKEKRDEHPAQKSLKFCCREHFRIYKREHGCGNKGKTWEETYSPETLKMMKKRITAKGKDHHLYGLRRADMTIRNLLDNPMKSESERAEIDRLMKEDPKRTMDMLLKNMVKDKSFYQRIAYEA